MVEVETPGLTRGVAVLPPANWVANPTMLQTLLSGLAGNPLVNAVTADQLFDAVPQGSSGESAIPRTLAATKPSSSVAQASSIRVARDQVSAFATVVPARSMVEDQVTTQLLVAESADLPGSTRQAILDRVGTTTQDVFKRIRLPGASSITVTSSNASVPLTVLSDPSVAAHVQLRLSSTKLAFHEFTPPGGQPCVVAQPTLETCDLVLTTAVTTLRVPVEARTSGVFPLSVTLWSPDGSLQLDSNANTVRSTAVSGVGIIIIVVAALFLGAWWIRDVRHGRRARQLIDRPPQTGPPSDASTGASESGPSPEGPAVPALEPSGVRPPRRRPAADREAATAPEPPPAPVPPQPKEGSTIEAFFASPPPEYRR